MGGLTLFVTEGLPEAQGEEQLRLFGMRLDKMGAKKKKASEISSCQIRSHSVCMCEEMRSNLRPELTSI